jgi:acyl-CoA thioesterase-1
MTSARRRVSIHFICAKTHIRRDVAMQFVAHHFVAYHFVSGDAMFAGVFAILLGLILSLRPDFRGRGTAIRILSVIGALFVAAAAIPFPYWIYVPWGVSLVIWLVYEARKSGGSRRAASISRAIAATITIVAPLSELAWRAEQFVEPRPQSILYVIGDSMSAESFGSDERTWPVRLREDRHLDVVNLSQIGATVRSAMRQAEHVEQSPAFVLIEIGGNDILGETSTSRFAADLDALLNRLRRPGRQLVMLELPLPPFYNGYGRIQRRLAKQHGVVLIPRREFAGVIFAADATTDGLHLSETGQRLMADMLWRHMSPSFDLQDNMDNR